MGDKQLKLKARILKPSYLTVDQVQHFMKSHAVVHGTVVGKDGKVRPQVIARYFENPDEPNVPHIHAYTNKKEKALRIFNMFKVAWQPWNPENERARMNTFSYGQKETWFTPPVFSDSFVTKLQMWQGKPSSRHVGPYWYSRKEPTNRVVWIQGRLEDPEEVSDIQVGQTEEPLSYSDKVMALKPLQEWAAKVRDGEPTLTE